MYKFKNNPEEFYNSEGYYRMLVLISVLQKDLGATFNMDLADKDGKLTWEDLKKHSQMIPEMYLFMVYSLENAKAHVRQRLH